MKRSAFFKLLCSQKVDIRQKYNLLAEVVRSYLVGYVKIKK